MYTSSLKVNWIGKQNKTLFSYDYVVVTIVMSHVNMNQSHQPYMDQIEQ